LRKYNVIEMIKELFVSRQQTFYYFIKRFATKVAFHVTFQLNKKTNL